MACIVEFGKKIRLDFAKNQYKQKVWIEVLLNINNTNIDYLALILNLPSEVLEQVHQGTRFLEREAAERLGQLFLITFWD